MNFVQTAEFNWWRLNLWEKKILSSEAISDAQYICIYKKKKKKKKRTPRENDVFQQS